jgi:hypothetical protein
MLNLVSRIVVRQVVISVSAGKLSAGAITPAATPTIPNGVVAADVYSAAAWDFTDVAGGVVFPVLAGEVRHLPGAFVKDAIFAIGTYRVCFYMAS